MWHMIHNIIELITFINTRITVVLIICVYIVHLYSFFFLNSFYSLSFHSVTLFYSSKLQHFYVLNFFYIMDNRILLSFWFYRTPWIYEVLFHCLVMPLLCNKQFLVRPTPLSWSLDFDFVSLYWVFLCHVHNFIEYRVFTNAISQIIWTMYYY